MSKARKEIVDFNSCQGTKISLRNLRQPNCAPISSPPDCQYPGLSSSQSNKIFGASRQAFLPSEEASKMGALLSTGDSFTFKRENEKLPIQNKNAVSVFSLCSPTNPSFSSKKISRVATEVTAKISLMNLKKSKRITEPLPCSSPLPKFKKPFPNASLPKNTNQLLTMSPSNRSQQNRSNFSSKATEERSTVDVEASKVSLSKGQKGTRSEVLLSLRYDDLRQPLRWDSQHPHHTPLPPCLPLSCCQPKCRRVHHWFEAMGPFYQIPAGRRPTQEERRAAEKQVERDLGRTHPGFGCEPMAGALRELLLGYAELDPEVGYVQGMNFLGAALLHYLGSTALSLRLMAFLMHEKGYRRIFLGDLGFSRTVAGRLVHQLKRLGHDLYLHLVSEGVDLALFAQGWYFSLCGSFVPLDSMYLLVEKFLERGYSGLNQLLLALLLLRKQQLLEMEETQLMLQLSNQRLCASAAKVDWEQLRRRSDNFLLPPCD